MISLLTIKLNFKIYPKVYRFGTHLFSDSNIYDLLPFPRKAFQAV
jgi:hypothetical protein